jgi:hypothetical protein
MPAFSLTDAAFEGFRLTRERPRVVAAWAALYMAMGIITPVVMIATVGPQFETLQATVRGGDLAESARLYQKLAPFYAVILPFVLAFWSVMTCAVYRAVLRPDEKGVGRFRLGADELRMAGLIVLLCALLCLNIFVATLFVSFGTIVVAAGSGALAVLLTSLISLAGLVASIWVWVRLALAGPMTFMTGEIHIFRSWGLTKGHFWPLVGALALATALAIVVLLLAMVIFTAIIGVVVTLGGGSLADAGRILQPKITSVASLFTPTQIVSQIFFAVLQVVVYAVLISPAAVIYAALSGKPINT